MSIIGTATNSSPYLAAPAAAAIENGKNHFVTLGENGVSLATEGVAAVGILLPDTEEKVAAGEGVTVQIKAWGLYAMVYTYTSYANTELDMDALKAFDLWIADYRGKRPARKHGIWQYTSEGTIPGITGNVDLNHAYKNYPAIIQRAGLSVIR